MTRNDVQSKIVMQETQKQKVKMGVLAIMHMFLCVGTDQKNK